MKLEFGVLDELIYALSTLWFEISVVKGLCCKSNSDNHDNTWNSGLYVF